MRVLALDMGEKNIGVAVSDPLGFTAQGIKVIRRVNLKRDLAELHKLIKEYGITEIIIGYPLNMNGTPGEKARETIAFKDKLAGTVSLPVIVWDERLTTVAAQRTLMEAGLRRRARKKVVDKVAAALILEGYLRYRSFREKHREDKQQ